MAEYLIQDSTLTAIADAIRSKTGTMDPIPTTDMASTIEGIVSGAYDIIATDNGDGTQSLAIADATGNSGTPNLQAKSVTYTSNGTATVTPDSGYDGLSSVDVQVNVSGGGGVETCTLTTSVDKAPGIVHGTIYAYSGDTLITITSKGTYSINKNSLIFVKSASAVNEVTGLEELSSSINYNENLNILVYNVTSDIATYKFSM